MKYSYEITDFIKQLNAESRQDFFNRLKSVGWSEYRSFSRSWLTDLMIQTGDLSDDEFICLCPAKEKED